MLTGVRARSVTAGGAPYVARGPREASADRGTEFVAALEAASRRIQDPVAKLRFIRRSLRSYQRLDRCLRLVPSARLRQWFYRILSIEGLRPLMAANSLGAAPADLGTHRAFRMNRAVAAGLALVFGGGAVAAAYRISTRLPPAPPVLAAAPPAAPSHAPVAEAFPPLPSGVRPAAVWLVEKGAGWEQYSNGLRIDTQFSVAGEPRGYRVFDADGSMGPLQEKPAGILFHTSESDIWPLEADFNEHLRDSSHKLLLYVHRLRLYNYLIDRFGRVFRVVEEDTRANHAGHAVWERGGRFYLSLNNAFLGVCFETRWEGGLALPITQAQLAAGRNLSEYLRQRFEVPPDMCVTHGLTSVNAKTHLIGHHLDWARGFPFDAFGLPDQYGRPAPSVAAFGFTYDEEFLKVLGQPWEGVRAAERALASEAQRQGKTVDGLRRERQRLYDRWLAEQARDEEARASSRADRAPVRGPRGG